VPLHNAPQLSDEEIEEILSQSDEERAWHQALTYFIPYMASRAFDAVRRCDRPTCGRYFVCARPDQLFCSGSCAKTEARKHSTARTRANLRRKIVVIVQAEMDRLDGRRFSSQSEWKDAIATNVNKLIYQTGTVITGKFVTRHIRSGVLRLPASAPQVDE
jgi:hypothetical protein